MAAIQKKHPNGLYPLICTEVWERFGFYMLQTVIVLYMSNRFGFVDSYAYYLYGAFSSMLYLTPVIGGYIADRFIGFRQSIMIGAFFLMLGYAVMLHPNKTFLFLGLSLVIIGNGFFKPNVSSIVGGLYSQEDPRKDSGFTLFYMGINIGAMIPPLIAGFLVSHYGYRSNFFVASLGMLAAIVIFSSFKKTLGRVGEVPSISPIYRSPKTKKIVYSLVALGILVGLILLHLVFHFPEVTAFVLIGVSLVVLTAVLFFISKELPEQRKRMYASLLLILVSIGFWAVYSQTYTSMMLFAERNMEKHFLGIRIQPEFIQFFNSFYIILLSPFLSRLWLRLTVREKNPSIPIKFASGILFMSAGFYFLSFGIRMFHTPDGMTSIWWLVGSYFLQTVGELLISPIGLAMITRLTPPHLVGMMMGVWFLTVSAAFAIGGAIANFSDVPKAIYGISSLEIYANAFSIYGSIALVLGLISIAMIPCLNHLIQDNQSR